MPFSDFNPSDIYAYDSRTLLQLRTLLMQRLGFSAQAATPPPGMTELLNGILADAQITMFEKYDLFRTDRLYSWPCVIGQRFYDLASPQEAITLPTPVNAAFATATTGGSLIAATYYYRVTAINAYGETLGSAETSQIVPAGTSTNTVTVNWTAVVAPSGASAVTGYKIYGRTTGAELLIAAVGLVTTYLDTGSITPAGALPLVNSAAFSSKLVNPRHIEWVGVQVNTQFIPMAAGIRPEYYGPAITGIPSSYEIRQTLEVWPSPSSTAYTLWVKGNFGILPFAIDTDSTTIDWQVVFLYALFLAKAHYAQPDAAIYRDNAMIMIGDLVAGSHQNRYVPGAVQWVSPPQPTMTAYLP